MSEDSFTNKVWEAFTKGGGIYLKVRRSGIVQSERGYYNVKKPALLVHVWQKDNKASVLLPQETVADLYHTLGKVLENMVDTTMKRTAEADAKNAKVAAEKKKEAQASKESGSEGKPVETYDITGW